MTQEKKSGVQAMTKMIIITIVFAIAGTLGYNYFLSEAQSESKPAINVDSVKIEFPVLDSIIKDTTGISEIK